MPEWAAVVILGIIEGVTEFLPVSSTGHLLLAENSHLLPEQSELFNVVIQAGAVLAVFLAFWRRVKDLALNLKQRDTRDYLLKLMVAFALTGAGGLLAKKAGFALPKETWPVAWATLVGGMVALGSLVSAVVAFLVVRWLLRWVQTHTFVAFGWYRIALGLVMAALAHGSR